MNVYETTLLSSDHGFCPKDQSGPIRLPEADIYKIKYEDKYKRQLLVAGDWDKVSKILKKAGYNVAVE